MSTTLNALLTIEEAVACAFGVAFLSPSEQALLAVRSSVTQQQNFTAGRWLLKKLLIEHLGGQLLDWSILPDALGRPQVFFQNQPHTAHVSISHSRSHVLCGLSLAGAIGVDIEEIRPRRDLTALVTRICSAKELAWWQNQPEPLHAFYKIWCAKEAVGKLRGTGLSAATLRTEALVSLTDTRWRTHDNIGIEFLQTMHVTHTMQAIASLD